MDNSELFSDFVPDTQLAQTQAVTGANGNPDNAAKALDISKKTGVPASVAEPNLDQFYQQWKQKSASTAVQSNPAAAGYVASNPMAAKVSGDDWENLQRSSKTLNSYTDGNLHSALVNGPLQAIRRLAGAFEGAKEGTGDKPLSEAISPEDWANHPVWAAVLSPLIYGIEGAKKATGAGVGAASGYSYYWAKDAGMSDADAGKFARDIGIFATGAMVESGIGPKIPHFTPGGELPELKVTPEAAQSVAAGEVPRPGADPTFDQLHQIQQKVDSVKVGQMVEDAEASKTRERSPEMYSQFVKEHGTENETISIPAETIRDLYSTEGKSLDDPKGPMAYVNGLGDAVEKGLDSGTEVKIPLSDYVANTDSALHAKLADSIRFREDGVTGEEAKELGKAKAEYVGKAAVRVGDEIFTGLNHAFALQDAEKKLGNAFEESVSKMKEEDEGFITSKNRFVTREEALKIANDTGQADERQLGQWSTYLRRNINQDDMATLFAEEVGVPKKILADLLKNEDAKAVAISAQQQRQTLYLNPLFKDAKTFGLTETEFNRYSNLIENSQNEIIARSIAASEREVKKPLTAEWKKNEKATRFQAEKETLGRPEIAADRFLRSGELPGGSRVKLEGKLNAEAVTEALGKDHALEDLTQAKGGVLPDDISPMLGFDSGKAMLKALDEFNQGRKKQGLAPKAYLDRIVDKETQARMQAQYGFLPDKILAEARDIALNNIQGELFDTEIRALAKQGGFDLPVSKEILQDKARNDFAALTLDKVPTEAELRRAIEKGGRNAEKAPLKGDFEDALKSKMAQRQAYWFHRELKDFQRDQAKLDRDVARVKDDGSATRIDSEHLMQTRKILDRLGVQAGKYPEGMASTADFVRQSDGRIAAADWIMIDEGLRTSMDQLTTEEVRDLQKTVQSILHVGRDTKKLDTAFGQAQLEDVVRDTVKELDRFDLIKQPLSGSSIKQRVGSMMRSIAAANILPERILDYTDKFNPNGPLSRWMDRPLREAFAKKLQYQEKIVKDLRALREFTNSSVSDIIDNKLIRDPLNNEPVQMNRWNLRKLMLYMGSESGREKVIRGFFQGKDAKALDPMEMDYLGKQVEKMIDANASEKDVGFVNSVFAIHEKLLPDIQKLQLDDTGVPMDVVQKRGYKLQAGDVDGGYTRIRYDKDRSSISEDLRADQSWFESGYRTITTPHGFTERRTGYSGFVDLDMTLFASELDSVVHDLSFRTAVRNAGKLVNSPDWSMAMRQKWGTEYADLFPQWLKDIANSGTVDDQYAKGFVKLLAGFRQNVVSALVGGNIGTMEKHGLSALGMSIKEVGPKEFFSNALSAMFKDGKELAKEAVSANPELADYYKSLTTERGMSEVRFALNSSPILRNRMKKHNETIYGAYDEATAQGLWGQAKNIRQLSIYFGRMPISLVDGMSTIPEWLAAYKREMGATGDHGTAVYAADKAVSRSHGSSFIGDAPAIIRQKNTLGGEMMRWVTPLYRFWNHNFNLLAGEKWDIGGKLTGRDEPGATWKNITNTAFWVTVVPIIAEEIAAPPLDSKKHGESIIGAVGRYFGGQLPFVRDISNAVLNGYEPSVGLLGSVGRSLATAGHEVTKQGDKAISRLMTGLAMLTGVGSQPLGNATQYGTHVLEGKERPGTQGHLTATDIYQGIRTGSQRPRRY